MVSDEQMMIAEFGEMTTHDLIAKLHHLNRKRTETVLSSVFHNLSIQIQIIKEVLSERFEEEDEDSDSLRSMPNSNVVVMLSAMIAKRAQMPEGEQADNLSAHITVVQDYIIQQMGS